MRGLLGDRFLRRFAGDSKHRRKQSILTGGGENPTAEAAATPGPEDDALDCPASNGDRGQAGADNQDVLIQAEPNKQNEPGPKAD